jgi:exonuclease III
MSKPNGSNSKRLQQRKRSMIIGTWNVCSIRNTISEVTKELREMKVDIAAITENKNKGVGNSIIGEYLHFWSGVDKSKRAKSGVSLFIKTKYRKNIRDYECINDRCIKLTMKIFGQDIIFLVVYAPTNDATVKEKDDFYEMLTAQMDIVRSNQELILMGDLNGKVGSRRNDDVVGMHGETEVNDNGDRLISLCTQYNLKISNTFYDHKNIHKFT